MIRKIEKKATLPVEANEPIDRLHEEFYSYLEDTGLSQAQYNGVRDFLHIRVRGLFEGRDILESEIPLNTLTSGLYFDLIEHVGQGFDVYSFVIAWSLDGIHPFRLSFDYCECPHCSESFPVNIVITRFPSDIAKNAYNLERHVRSAQLTPMLDQL